MYRWPAVPSTVERSLGPRSNLSICSLGLEICFDSRGFQVSFEFTSILPLPFPSCNVKDFGLWPVLWTPISCRWKEWVSSEFLSFLPLFSFVYPTTKLRFYSVETRLPCLRWRSQFCTRGHTDLFQGYVFVPGPSLWGSFRLSTLYIGTLRGPNVGVTLDSWSLEKWEIEIREPVILYQTFRVWLTDTRIPSSTPLFLRSRSSGRTDPCSPLGVTPPCLLSSDMISVFRLSQTLLLFLSLYIFTICLLYFNLPGSLGPVSVHRPVLPRV